MSFKAILLTLISCVIFTARAVDVTHEPLYIVGGVERSAEEVVRIPPAEIESMESLPADEESIARYGERASNGVVLITLRYDTAARFRDGDCNSLDEWLARRVVWSDDEVAARVVLRLNISADGKASVDEVLEATDKRLLRRVVKALETAPAWTPAMKNSAGVASQAVVRVQLPEGKPMPRQIELVIR